MFFFFLKVFIYSLTKDQLQSKGVKGQDFIVFVTKIGLELDHLALSLLVTSQFKMLASLNSQHPLRSAVGLNTLQSQHNLLCSFSLFAENRLSLPTIATLFPVITPLSLGIQRILALLVLCHLVGLVLPTFLAEGPAGLRNVHLIEIKCSERSYRTTMAESSQDANKADLSCNYSLTHNDHVALKSSCSPTLHQTAHPPTAKSRHPVNSSTHNSVSYVSFSAILGFLGTSRSCQSPDAPWDGTGRAGYKD